MHTMILRIGRLRARLGFGLATLAVIALLFSQAGLVWHALEHLSPARSADAQGLSASLSTAKLTDAGKSGGEATCLKCLEGLSHTTALLGDAIPVVFAAAPGQSIAAIAVVPVAWSHSQPRQRGPPACLI